MRKLDEQDHTGSRIRYQVRVIRSVVFGHSGSTRMPGRTHAKPEIGGEKQHIGFLH